MGHRFAGAPVPSCMLRCHVMRQIGRTRHQECEDGCSGVLMREASPVRAYMLRCHVMRQIGRTCSDAHGCEKLLFPEALNRNKKVEEALSRLTCRKNQSEQRVCLASDPVSVSGPSTVRLGIHLPVIVNAKTTRMDDLRQACICKVAAGDSGLTCLSMPALLQKCLQEDGRIFLGRWPETARCSGG